MSSPHEDENEEPSELSTEAASLLEQFKKDMTPDERRRDRIFGRICAETEESTRSSDEASEERDEDETSGRAG